MATTRPAGTNLLSDLPDRLAGQLLSAATPRNLSTDEVLFFAGDPGDGIYRVDEGLLKVSIASASGAERILAILGPGSIVGDLAIIDGLPRSATVTALRDCKLRFLSRAAFEKFAASEPAIYKYLLKVMAARLRDTDAIVAAGSFLPLKGRVARALLDLAHAFGNDVGKGRVVIRQKVSQSDLAAMAGIARENVSRIMNDWMRAKVVTRLSGYYCLENTKKLQAEIEV
ncbi:MAG TPA: Crp/Fnr family transcriptional regulator [Pseudolabrys sp.]|nr:Crp/Fnr family transcriptional regulator [Pseudolabrys sp.]